MTRKVLLVFFLFVQPVLVNSVCAEEISISDNDTIQSILENQAGKPISITMKSGRELSGKLAKVTDKLTHISELTGKEFYDAVVSTDRIESVTVRTK